jgi:hypothetical protein
MAYETYFNADDLDLDAALLAGFGLKNGTEEMELLGVDEVATAPGETDGHGLLTHARVTHRVGTVGRLQVRFVYHHGDHRHE